MSNQSAERTIKSHTSLNCKMALPRFYSQVCNFCVEERTLCISAPFFYGLGYNEPTYEKLRQFAGLCEGRMSPAVLAQG